MDTEESNSRYTGSWPVEINIFNWTLKSYLTCNRHLYQEQSRSKITLNPTHTPDIWGIPAYKVNTLSYIHGKHDTQLMVMDLL